MLDAVAATSVALAASDACGSERALVAPGPSCGRDGVRPRPTRARSASAAAVPSAVLVRHDGRTTDDASLRASGCGDAGGSFTAGYRDAAAEAVGVSVSVGARWPRHAPWLATSRAAIASRTASRRASRVSPKSRATHAATSLAVAATSLARTASSRPAASSPALCGRSSGARQRMHRELGERGGHRWPDDARVRDAARRDVDQCLDGILTPEQALAREQLPKDDARREHIGTSVGRPPRDFCSGAM